MKKILIIFTTAKVVQTLLIAFWWLLVTLKSEITKFFLEKHYTGVHTNIEQKPSEASLTGDIVRRN